MTMSEFTVLMGDEAVSALSLMNIPEGSTSFFQGADWLRLWNGRPRCKCGIVVVPNAMEPDGYFPFCIRKVFGFKECYSMPMGTYGGAVAPSDSNDIRRHINEAFVKWACSNDFSRINVIEFKTGTDESFSLFKNKLMTTHILRLDHDEDRLYAVLSDNHKRNLKKSAEHNFEIRPVESESDVREYYQLIVESAQRHESNPRYDIGFYNSLCRIVAKEEIIWQLVYLDDRPCVGHIYFKSGKKILYWDGCTNNVGLRTSANFHLFWNNIKSFREQGFESLNFGSSPQGADNLVRFKKGWGANEVMYHEYNRESISYRSIKKARGWLRI